MHCHREGSGPQGPGPGACAQRRRGRARHAPPRQVRGAHGSAPKIQFRPAELLPHPGAITWDRDPWPCRRPGPRPRAPPRVRTRGRLSARGARALGITSAPPSPRVAPSTEGPARGDQHVWWWFLNWGFPSHEPPRSRGRAVQQAGELYRDRRKRPRPAAIAALQSVLWHNARAEWPSPREAAALARTPCCSLFSFTPRGSAPDPKARQRSSAGGPVPGVCPCGA